MTELFDENVRRIQARWPLLLTTVLAAPLDTLTVELREGQQTTLLVEGIQLSSRHDREAEARYQVATVPEQASDVHLYGTGLGEVITALLARPALQTLHVHLLNESLFSLLLRLLPMPWLADPRVQLHHAAEFREIQFPYLALPAELRLANEANSRMRDRLVAEIEWPYVSRQFNTDDAEKQTRLRQNLTLFAEDADVGTLFGRHSGAEFIVIASGPSLTRHYAKLCTLQATGRCPPIICVDTAYLPLVQAGIRPDYVVSMDYNIHPGILSSQGDHHAALVYFPMIHHQVIADWSGPRYCAYSTASRYAAAQASHPRKTLFASGSVLHPAVDLAVQMGASRLTLLGADFAFIGSETHAGWPAGLLTPTSMSTHWVLNGHGQRVTTLLNFRSYLCYLERYIAAHPQVAFFNGCKDGAYIEGAEYAPFWCAAEVPV